MDNVDMLLTLLQEVKAELVALRTNGCNKAMMHEVIESRLTTLEANSKDTKIVGLLTLPWPWLFASVAVFSPNAVAIVEVIKGVAR